MRPIPCTHRDHASAFVTASGPNVSDRADRWSSLEMSRVRAGRAEVMVSVCQSQNSDINFLCRCDAFPCRFRQERLLAESGALVAVPAHEADVSPDAPVYVGAMKNVSSG